MRYNVLVETLLRKNITNKRRKGMNKIVIVPTLKKFELKRMFNDYLKELSSFDDSIKFDENGEPIYRYFDCYFSDKDRYPFFFCENDLIVGFCPRMHFTCI